MRQFLIVLKIIRLQCGVFNISNSYGYIYMDPNVNSGYVINYVDYSLVTNTNNDTLYFYSGNMFYETVWRCYYGFY